MKINEELTYGQFQISSLNGTNGFAINSNNSNDNFGISVGGNFDFNHDGISDVIIGADGGNGTAYIVFGSSNPFSAAINPQTLNVTSGSTIYGLTSKDHFGFAVSSAGDINADGIDDVIIGAYTASSSNMANVGVAYVIFGNANITNHIFVKDLNGINGFTIEGINPNDHFGYSVSGATGGDFNGDGIADVIIGAPNANKKAGQIYIVFGSKDPFPKLMMAKELNSKNGFIVDAMNPNYTAGYAVSLGGDYNDDGLKDIIVGAPYANDGDGIAYTIFGSKHPPAVFKLTAINGFNGFSVAADMGYFGIVTSQAGDVNADGIDDMIIGTNVAGNPGPSSIALVIYGKTSPFPSNMSFSIMGGRPDTPCVVTWASCHDGGNFQGVSGIGDVNNDGIDDYYIGVTSWHSSDDDLIEGSNYVIFGNHSIDNLVSVCYYNDAVQISYPNIDDNFGWSVAAAGDINADGISDFIVGSPTLLMINSHAYVIFGSSSLGNATELAGKTEQETV